MRAMLADIGARMWLELEFGTSYQGYRCLDAYVSLFFPGMAPPRNCAWYLLNHSRPAAYRKLYLPSEWYHLRDWLSIGQRPSMTEWTVSLRQELARRTPAEQQRGHRRMSIFLRHVSAGASAGGTLPMIALPDRGHAADVSAGH